MKNNLTLRLSLLILTPLILISLSYFLFLTRPELFTKSFEKYVYQDYSLIFEEVVTNKNPLYPELTFENILLKDKKGIVSIDRLKVGINLLGYFFDDIKRLKYLKVYATEIKTEDYINLLPENSVALKKNLLNIIDDGNIDELYFESIEGANININNELIISKATINIASERKLTANKVFVTANNREVKIRLEQGLFENLPYDEISGFLDMTQCNSNIFLIINL